MELGLGRMCISPTDFWQMSWAEFVLAAEGYYHNQMERLDMHRRLLLMIRNSNAHPNDRITAEEFWPLPIDANYQYQLQIQEQIEAQQNLPFEDAIAKAKERIKNRPFLKKVS